MADRGGSAAFITQLTAQKNQPFHLVRADFDAGSVYMTDCYRAITWSGQTWQALGHLLAFDGLEESADVRIPQVRISLSGVDQVWTANVLNNAYIDRRVRIWKGFLDSGDAVVVDPIAIFNGFMDAPVIDEDPDGGKSTVTITCVDRGGGQIEQRPGRHTNDAEQQLLFPGDRFFQYVSQINTQITWGAP